MNALTTYNRLSNLSNGLMRPTRDDLFAPFQEVFDNFFSEFWSDLKPVNIRSKANFPKWDIYEDGKTWNVEVCLPPGMTEQDVKVELVPTNGNDPYDRVLKISGKCSDEVEDKGRTYHAREIRRSAFTRSVYVPNELEGEPEAILKDGVLRLSWKLPELPAQEKPQSKQIEIKKA